MSNIRYLESMVDHFWPEMHRVFPAIEKPMIVPARTLRGLAPMYMKRYIDQDENSFYMFIKADPLKGDSSRDMACRFFDDFFYNKMKMPSSYDIESGMAPTDENPEFGTMSREDAISKEVLPAQDDRNYKQFYDEQIAKMNQEAAEAKKQANIEKLGFDPDSEDIIDIDNDGNIIDPTQVKTRAVANQDSHAVGMPLKIFYGVDFHISAGGNQLGYGGAGRLGRRNRGLLRNSEEVSEGIGREAGQIGYDLLSIIKRAGMKEGLGLALSDVYEKFFGPLPNEQAIDKILRNEPIIPYQNEDELDDSEVEFNESIMNKFRNYFN